MKQGVFSVFFFFIDEVLNGIVGYNIVDVFWDFFVKFDDFISEIVIVIGMIEEVIV